MSGINRIPRWFWISAAVAAALMAFAACSGKGEDRPGGVEVIGSGTGSVSASVSGIGGPVNPGKGVGGYEPVSNVDAHARVVLDVVEINGLLGQTPINYAAVQALYEEGKHSVNSDGSVRTIAGFARNANRSEPVWDDYKAYYGDPVWLDTFVMSAIEGTGAFAGEPDAVRKQGIQKGIQNQIMVAWTIHELVEAMKKAEAGNIDPASGAPHNWDEAWAFYHGADPNGGPYATADKRGGNFGKGNAVNSQLLKEMIEGRDALVAGDVHAAEHAMDAAIGQIKITYIQAAIRYSQKITDALEAGDDAAARVDQAEGWSFFRVIEPMVAQANPDASKRVASYFDLANQLSPNAGPEVKKALEAVYEALGVSAADVGTLQG